MSYTRTDIAQMAAEIAPALYDSIDLSATPERFAPVLDERAIKRGAMFEPDYLEKLAADTKKMEFYRQLTLMGDPIADAFVARGKAMGFAHARKMLELALEEGIDKVADAPEELIALIRDMETVPDWVDWNLIEETGADYRLTVAIFQRYVMRFGFMMTYLNGYQGLPMLLTGALAGPGAGKRMLETNSTFMLMTMPGALRRGGVAFKSAAKVRVMHALVRSNLLAHKEKWNYEIYGMPIPQVDQLGAAMIVPFLLTIISKKLKRPLSRSQRGVIERFRYLGSLMGLHEYFISGEAEKLLEPWAYLFITLNDHVDPGAVALNMATLHGYVRPGTSRLDKLIHTIDVASTRFVYTRAFGKRKARQMGIVQKPADALATAALSITLASQLTYFSLARLLPGGKQRVDDWAIAKINEILTTSGKAKYHTEAAHYSMGNNPGAKSPNP